VLHDSSVVDHAVIRGRRIDLDRHVDTKLFDPDYVAELRQQLRKAEPYPHLVVDGWFNPTLLELVREEFDQLEKTQWKVFRNEQELTHRSQPHSRLGPASEIYFSIVNSGWFLDLISAITDTEDLLPDPKLLGGGLHETRAGGKFGIHRDFDLHASHGLSNKMVFMTYLNRGWDPAWGAALEIWDIDTGASARSILPEFGTSVLLMHGPKSFHGHPEPMTAPPGQTRRSVAVYYYQNPAAVPMRLKRVSSVFLVAHRSKPLRHFARRWLPPIVLDAIKKLVSR
jgi:Rps23 Pro-64 3,4-dihydroxylase Tpa1-like proline 4-hydroxylase